jgi:predicted enzyme related to lactoylglutathione lyase
MIHTSPSPLVHLELHTTNLARACTFYTRVCGWQIEQLEVGGRSHPALDWGGPLDGGIVECGTSGALWIPYLEVSQIDEATERARRFGASVLFQPREGPAGWRSVVQVPHGGEIAFWQPKTPNAGRSLPERRSTHLSEEAR